jgi:spoIIIJ-associated protein
MKDQIQEFVERLVGTGGFDLSVSVEVTGEDPVDYTVQLAGPDRGLLLGRGAELLDALEYITNRAFGKQMHHDAKIDFDSGNYRGMREKELRMMAEMAAQRVRGSRSSFVFEPMSPSERRIIHLALVDDRTVRTESVGDGVERKVKVVPA